VVGQTEKRAASDTTGNQEKCKSNYPTKLIIKFYKSLPVAIKKLKQSVSEPRMAI
jgi:hypothetical protein